MTNNQIRLQYSGFMIFAARMVSVATGLIFQSMVARSLLPIKAEYDMWFNINDVIAYFTIMAGVLPFWTTRFVARQKKGAVKTGVIANLAISVLATLVYLLLIPFVVPALGISVDYLPLYFFVSIQILELYSITVLEACLQAKIPQAVGYGLIVQHICKVTLGYVLIVHFHQLLLGAIVTAMVGFALQTVYYLKLLAQEFREKINWSYVKQWLKGSVANVYSVAGNQIATYIFIMLFIYGGEGARGRLGAATIVVNVITYSSFLAYALYPKLLAERKSEDITTALKMVLTFAIPMTVGAIALSDSYISILTGAAGYVDAAPVLMVSAIDAFIIVISGIFGSVLFGFETVDEGAKLSLGQLVKSPSFKAFSLPYLHSAMTIPTAFIVLTRYAQDQPLQAALSVSIINLSGRLAMFFVQYAIVRKMTKIAVPWKAIAGYIFAATAMGSLLYLAPHPTDAFLILIETAAGGVVYLALLMVIDKEARGLPKDVLREIRHR